MSIVNTPKKENHWESNFLHNEHNHNPVGELDIPPDLDAPGDQLWSIQNPVGDHKNPWEMVKVLKKITHFMDFPVLCALTYIQQGFRGLKPIPKLVVQKKFFLIDIS